MSAGVACNCRCAADTGKQLLLDRVVIGVLSRCIVEAVDNV
jgi:hypothetical protein